MRRAVQGAAFMIERAQRSINEWKQRLAADFRMVNAT